MPRKTSPDGPSTIDADRGHGSVRTKQGRYLAKPIRDERTETRGGYRELDQLVEGSEGLTRSAKDRERAVPRGTAAPLGHQRMERQLPAKGDVRGPLSSRQRKARNIAKRAGQDAMPNTQYQAMSHLLGEESTWRNLNDKLSDNVGDAQALGEDDRKTVQRVDRAIQTAERHNERGHVVYANVRLQSFINHTNIHAVISRSFRPGDVVEFDRFTAGAHTMHEIDPRPGEQDRSFAFEIQTRRGMYLGRSDSVDDTSHLLPRGMRFRIQSAHQADYQRPDGSRGRRWVVQLVDITDTPGVDTRRPNTKG